jgi:molybdopterin-guanine dinucleotide biosynthesis protein A
VKKIAEPQLRAADPDLISFFNINTPEDLAASKKMSMEGRGIATTSNED